MTGTAWPQSQRKYWEAIYRHKVRGEECTGWHNTRDENYLCRSAHNQVKVERRRVVDWNSTEPNYALDECKTDTERFFHPDFYKSTVCFFFQKGACSAGANKTELCGRRHVKDGVDYDAAWPKRDDDDDAKLLDTLMAGLGVDVSGEEEELPDHVMQLDFGTLERQFPTFFQDVSMQVDKRSCVEDVLRHWRGVGLSLDQWLAPYWAPNQCMRLNHPAGGGCLRGSDCTYDHVCMLCGRQGHGVYQEKQNGSWRCPTMARLEKEQQQLWQEYTLDRKWAVRWKLKSMVVTPNAGQQQPPSTTNPWQRQPQQDQADEQQPPQVLHSDDQFPALGSPSGHGHEGDDQEEEDQDEDEDEDEETIESDRLLVERNKSTHLSRGTASNYEVYQGTYRPMGPEGGLHYAVAAKVFGPFVNKRDIKLNRELVQRETDYLLRLKEVDTEHVVRYVDNVEISNPWTAFAVVMERCHDNLANYVKQELAGRIDPKQARQFVMQLLQGYRACHAKGICHRDVKPENVLVKKDGGNVCLKLCDFGYSKAFAKAGRGGGTMRTRVLSENVRHPQFWAAPEMLSQHPGTEPDVDASPNEGYHSFVDRWSFGVLAYYIVTGGGILFQAEAEVHQAANDPDELRRLLFARATSAPFLENPLVFDFIRRFLVKSPPQRMAFADAIVHPYTWDTEFTLAVIHKVHKHANNAKTPEGTQLIRQLDQVGLGEMHWADRLPPAYQPPASGTERPLNKPSALLKHVRDRHEHLRLRASHGEFAGLVETEAMMVSALTKAFPDLLPLLYDVIQTFPHARLHWRDDFNEKRHAFEMRA